MMLQTGQKLEDLVSEEDSAGSSDNQNPAGIPSGPVTSFLTGISPSSGTLFPLFDNAVTGYQISVPFSTASLDITGLTSGALSIDIAARYDGSTLAVRSFSSGSASDTIALNPGNNEITLEAPGASGSVTYYLNVYRAAGNEKDISAFFLGGVSASSIALTGNPRIIEIYPPRDLDFTALTASFVTTGVRVECSGIPQISGITENNFSTPLIYTVFGEDGSTQAYEVRATAGISKNANLGVLEILPGSVTPVFTPTITDYGVLLSGSQNALTLRAEADDPLAAVTSVLFNGTPVPGGPSYLCQGLISGLNTLEIFVTAEDLSVTKTYTINIYRISTIFVDKDSGAALPDGLTWATAFRSFQDGINKAYKIAPCAVWVAEGTYYLYDTGPENTLLLLPDIKIYGGFAGSESSLTARDYRARPTIISGYDGPGMANQVYHVVMGNDALLDGFTITGGKANGGGPNQTRGGALFIENTSPVVQNTIFTGNFAEEGGAVYASSSSAEFYNCIVFDNDADEGGGFYSKNSTLKIVNSTVAHNSRDAFYNENSSPVLTNSIVWYNTPGTVINTGTSDLTAAYCNIQNGYTGTGNIQGAPLFQSITGRNYRLKINSPCIDSGTGIISPVNDFDMNSRYDAAMIDRGTGSPSFVDMGAFENQADDVTAPQVLSISPGPGSAINSFFTSFKVTFSENVLKADISSNYSLSAAGTGSLVIDSVTYDEELFEATVNLTGTAGQGPVTFTVSMNITDYSNNSLPASRSYNFTADGISPTLIGTTPTAGSSINTSFSTVNITYSEPVTGADVPANYLVSGPADCTLAITSVTSLGANSYALNFTGSPGNGTVTIDINAVSDSAGNPLSSSSIQYNGDTLAPSPLSIDKPVIVYPDDFNPANDSMMLTITFSEPVRISSNILTILSQYSIGGPGKGSLVIRLAAPPGGTSSTVTLLVAINNPAQPPVVGSTFTITVNSVEDLQGNTMTVPRVLTVSVNGP